MSKVRGSVNAAGGEHPADGRDRQPEEPARSIYLDHQATTPCDPSVVAAMLPCFSEDYGNPASNHLWGQSAAGKIETARESVARLLEAEPAEIVFTSGATESDNLALFGVMQAHRTRGWHLVSQVTEHRAVLDACLALESQGCEVSWVGVDEHGRVDPDEVASKLRDDTVMVSLMLANNEIGTLQPVAEVAQICRQRGVLVHTDAAQALATEDCSVARLGVDLLSISGHKAYGPKGVGALYLRRRRPRVRLAAQMHGGGHQRGRRSGTLNVPGIVGLGVACELVRERRADDRRRLLELRQRLLTLLQHSFPNLAVNGSLEHRLAGNLNVSLPGLEARQLLQELHGVALASGAACSSASGDGSYVIKALPGLAHRAESSLRFGLGRGTTEEELKRAVAALRQAAEGLARNPPTPVADPCAVDTCAAVSSTTEPSAELAAGTQHARQPQELVAS